MKKNITRKEFLSFLIEYADRSNHFNPHFYRKDMLKIMNISEGEFNIIQHQLGEKYCHFVDAHDGENRYAINVSECLLLQEKYEEELKNEQRHHQLVRLTILSIICTILGIILSFYSSYLK